MANQTGNGANLGFEAELWRAADALRSNMDAAEYKHVVLGLVFLKYISDAFEERHAFLAKAIDDPENEYYLKPDVPNRSDAVLSLLEDRDEYIAKNIFWVPKEARWSTSRPTPNSRPSAKSLTTPCSPSSGTTHPSRACCRRSTPVLASTSSGSAN